MSETKQLLHTISTPVTNILLNTQLALDYCQQQQDQSNLSHYLMQSLTASKYLQNFILQTQQNKISNKTFLVLPRIQAALNISQFAKKTGQIIKYLNLDAQITLLGNAYKFQEALICLLNNAFEAYLHHPLHKIVIFSASRKDRQLYMSITDGGNGMNWLQQKLATINGISYKTNHFGLGLAFAKKIFCKEMKGSLKILSKINRGTTITIKLPISNQ